MTHLARIISSFTAIWLLAGIGWGVTFLTITPVYAAVPAQNNPAPTAATIWGQSITFTLLITPTNGVTITNPRPTFAWADAVTDDPGGIISYTLLLTGSQAYTAPITTTASIYTPTYALPNGVYTWTVQAHDAISASGYVTPPATFTLAAPQVFLPIVFKSPQSECPLTSTATFNLIPIEGAPADHPDVLHGDLNLALRGYAPVNEYLGLVDYAGGSDPYAPQLAGLFDPHRVPGINAVYQINQWIWGCGEHGCRGPAITAPGVTLAGFTTTAGETVYLPERDPEIYGGDYKAMVLYAAEKRITLGYTRQDTVAAGYAVHIEDVCVDPNLLALYRAQNDAAGNRVTGYLPALRNSQALGTAPGSEIKVAVRDRGTFMDPRSRKDWWQGY
ncbi:MAG: hypothetical protein JW953_21415 [Anaerolineae bacterium]|nr:hypothetical protein [Anaerolineae bacterium]